MTHECVFIDAVRMATARAHKEKGERYGLATLCGGGGVSMACAVEML